MVQGRRGHGAVETPDGFAGAPELLVVASQGLFPMQARVDPAYIQGNANVGWFT